MFTISLERYIQRDTFKTIAGLAFEVQILNGVYNTRSVHTVYPIATRLVQKLPWQLSSSRVALPTAEIRCQRLSERSSLHTGIAEIIKQIRANKRI